VPGERAEKNIWTQDKKGKEKERNFIIKELINFAFC
jgi:hypothetical protein